MPRTDGPSLTYIRSNHRNLILCNHARWIRTMLVSHTDIHLILDDMKASGVTRCVSTPNRWKRGQRPAWKCWSVVMPMPRPEFGCRTRVAANMDLADTVPSSPLWSACTRTKLSLFYSAAGFRPRGITISSLIFSITPRNMNHTGRYLRDETRTVLMETGTWPWSHILWSFLD